MSRILKTMIVLLAIAAMAAPAFATDFSISGQMRVEGYYNKVDKTMGEANDDTDMHWEQRLRVLSVWKVSDEVKVVLRTDIGETTWGGNGQYSVRHPATNSEQFQIDKAYLQIDKEMFSVSAGQQFFGSDNEILIDHVGTGIVFKSKTPVSVKLMFTKYDENGANTDEDATDDKDFYGAVVGYKADSFSVSAIAATLDDSSDDGAKKIGYGIAGTTTFSNIAINAEFDILDGDDGGDIDYVGTQLFVKANSDVTETVNVGGFIWYVAGTDKDDEEVIVDITNWDDFNPFLGGYAGQTIVAGTPITGWGPNNFIDNAGIMSAALFATVNVNEDLGLKFQGQYSTEEEDGAPETGAYDFDLITLTASGKYKVATNTYFMADVIYDDFSSDDLGDNDSISFWTQLQVNF